MKDGEKMSKIESTNKGKPKGVNENSYNPPTPPKHIPRPIPPQPINPKSK